MMNAKCTFDDFTEAAYERCLRLARKHWAFRFFSDAPHEGRCVLWRHDVDLSPHRALRLAQIEAEIGVRATYFLHPHSDFYNLLEAGVIEKFRTIAALGHQIGLHFDPAFHGARLRSREDLECLLRREAGLLETVFEVPVHAFSYHNPDMGPWLSYDDDIITGLHNAYGRTLKETFSYVSDSNGFWRHRRLADVLADPLMEKLHVLTHPGWWQREALSPKQRIRRCIEGRAQAVLRNYENTLAENGRINLG